MKAIEIDWSKAPEGTTHYLPENDGHGWVACWFKQDGNVWMAWAVERDGGEWEEDNDMDEAVKFLIRRPSPWNGTGLPPAGCEIEYHSSSGGWRQGEYIGQFNGQMVIGCRETGVIGYCRAEIVRPIRTAEQIAAEEELEEIARLYAEGGPAAAYDAGYRKVEGDKQ